MEEGFMLVFPEWVLHGAIPDRDFLHLYGPGSLWALAGAFKVFGVSLLTERVHHTPSPPEATSGTERKGRSVAAAGSGRATGVPPVGADRSGRDHRYGDVREHPIRTTAEPSLCILAAVAIAIDAALGRIRRPTPVV